MPSAASVIAVVPARNEGDAVGAAVRALKPFCRSVIVVDDGSGDDTARVAQAAGAVVLSSDVHRGKGAALTAGVQRALVDDPDILLLADADLGSSAVTLIGLVEAVESGGVDIAIGTLPGAAAAQGGFGLVKRWAARSIADRTSWLPEQPLSGQRALSSAAAAALLPFAAGFGVETAMTIDALGAGLRVVEVPIEASHRPTGRGPRGFLHRARQGSDIARALRARPKGML